MSYLRPTCQLCQELHAQVLGGERGGGKSEQKTLRQGTNNNNNYNNNNEPWRQICWLAGWLAELAFHTFTHAFMHLLYRSSTDRCMQRWTDGPIDQSIDRSTELPSELPNERLLSKLDWEKTRPNQSISARVCVREWARERRQQSSWSSEFRQFRERQSKAKPSKSEQLIISLN